MSGLDPGTTASPFEILPIFLRLGLTCFGGPIAHIGYFRDEFVTRRRWLDERAYADLVGICQFLPGPASSQVGFSIGLMRGGLVGAIAAWIGFTLPSAILMMLFAAGMRPFAGAASGGLLHGLRLAAVAIVAQAVWGMARSFCPDRTRAAIALAATVIVLFADPTIGQLSAIGLGAVAGWCWCRPGTPGEASDPPVVLTRRAGFLALGSFAVLACGLPLLSHITGAPAIRLFDAFYRAGALVFGGGHVVLPLLRQAVVASGWVDDASFLAGYGAAQAVPGPLFTFAAYLGWVVTTTPRGIAGALIALVGIFLPGLLVLVGVLPFWQSIRRRAAAQSIMLGVNASVVGLLGAALYTPLWTGSVRTAGDFAIALTALLMLTIWRLPPFIVVGFAALGGLAFAGLAR